jgi:5'-3' exonuclease
MYKMHIGQHERRFISLETGNIQWKWVKYFLKELAKQEHTYILNEYVARYKMAERKYPEKTAEERQIVFDNIPVIYRQEETYICPQERGWEDRYYSVAFHGPVDKKTVCINYMEGLEWVFRYYTEGCPHWRWKYNYHYPPLLKDLVDFMPDFETQFIDSTRGTNRPFHANVQLSYVMPSWQHHLLPKEAQETIKKYPDLFQALRDVKFQWMFCRYFWESHVLLKEIPLELMEEWDATYI